MSSANNARNINSVFYAESYHPIQAGSIDGTDIAPHDNAIYRAFLCSSAGLYDPLGDPKLLGDPYCTVFVGRLSHLTTEDSLRKAMSKYGRVKKLRLVRDIVTGASRGYAFVEFETDREMRRAYKEAHHTMVDDSEIIVDYSRQQLMPGWIPRRLGGGLGGRKESGQLRFGGRERPFRAPLRPIPYDDLKKLGIPPPPEGQYVSRFQVTLQVPSPPRRKGSSADREVSTRSSSPELEEHRDRWKPVHGEHHHNRRDFAEREEHRSKRRSRENIEHSDKRTSREGREYRDDHSSVERERRRDKSSEDRGHHQDRSSAERERRRDKSGEDRVHSHDWSSVERRGHRDRSGHPHKEKSYKRAREAEDHSEYSDKRSSKHEEDNSRKHHKHERRSDKHKRRRSNSRDRYSER